MNPTVWEVDARVLEPGNRFACFHGSPWSIVQRTRTVKTQLLGMHADATEILCISEYPRACESSAYITLESGRKVVVPVLPKSL